MSVGKRTFAAPRTTPPPPSSPPGESWQARQDRKTRRLGDLVGFSRRSAGRRAALRFCVSSEGGVSAVPGQGTKISHATTHGQNKKTREHKTL